MAWVQSSFHATWHQHTDGQHLKANYNNFISYILELAPNYNPTLCKPNLSIHPPTATEEGKTGCDFLNTFIYSKLLQIVTSCKQAAYLSVLYKRLTHVAYLDTGNDIKYSQQQQVGHFQPPALFVQPHKDITEFWCKCV